MMFVQLNFFDSRVVRRNFSNLKEREPACPFPRPIFTELSRGLTVYLALQALHCNSSLHKGVEFQFFWVA